MKSLRNRNIVRPKISTMPRYQSESSTQLELYKMVHEKQRIQRELSDIQERIIHLQKRFNSLNSQIENTEKTIQELRQANSGDPENNPGNNPVKSNNYQTFEINY